MATSSISTQQTMTKKYEELVNNIRNLDQTFITGALLFIIVFITCMLLLYILYTTKLEARECSYMTKMYGDVNGKIRSNVSDASDFLCNYYVKTAYNCCSGGSYKNDYVNVCNLKSVIKQGARCLDFEIYSVDGMPVVSTSTADNYYVKETYNYVKFADAMSIIQLYAFGDGAPNKSDPIILHLRFKSNKPEMYKALAKIFQSYTTLMLGKEYSYVNKNNGGNLGMTRLSELKSKIVLIVDESNKSFQDNEKLVEYINATSNSGDIRSYPYFGVKNVPDIDELSNYNKGSFMTIVLPDGGVNPPNPSADYARELGCQFVAMRYQYVDNFLLSDTNFFDDNGYAFVQKLGGMRYEPVTIPPPIPQNPDLSYEQKTSEAPLGLTIAY
jgi:hypothetical protein